MFYLDYKNAFKGFKKINFIFLSLKEIFPNTLNYFKIGRIQKKTIHDLKYNLGCNIQNIRENYIFVEKNHLEINPHYGVFLYDTHRILDLFPNLTFVSKSQKELDDLVTIFEDSLCPITQIKQDLSKSPIDLDNNKFDSIALNFALDEVSSTKEELESFIKYLTLHLNQGGIIFGITVLGKELKTKNKNHIKYVKEQNERNIWNNLETTENLLESIFEKYFDYSLINTSNSYCIFRCSLNKPIKDVMPFKLDINKLDGKYLVIK